MKKMYEIHNKEIIPVEEKKKNFWIHLTNPTDEEIKAISEELQIEETVLRKTLDKSELPHIEIEENSILYVINIPYVILSKTKKKYRAFPFGIFLFEDGVLTVSTNNHPIIGDILTNKIPNLDFFNHDTFPIYMIGKSMEYYLKHLNEIQEDIRLKEKDLIKASSNKDLEHLLTLQKSLLYFTTSLQGNRAVLEKIENNNRLTSKEIDVNYLKYFLSQEKIYNLLNSSSGKSTMPAINFRFLGKLKINYPSLDEQKRIVKILDRFDKLCNGISEGLPAEIEARRKQYEYYRDKLLNFKELKVENKE